MDDEPQPEPTVERDELPDGRSVLYFSWPEEAPRPELVEEPGDE